MDNTEAALNGNAFLVLHEFCTLMYVLLLPVSFFLTTPNPFHNLILVTELSFSVFCISSSSSLTPSVSPFFVAD